MVMTYDNIHHARRDGYVSSADVGRLIEVSRQYAHVVKQSPGFPPVAARYEYRGTTYQLYRKAEVLEWVSNRRSKKKSS